MVNIWLRSLCALSPILPEFVLIDAKPSSSQISAPPQLPIVTSKEFSVFLFVHAWPLLNKSDFLACFIILISESEIATKCLAQLIAASNRFSEIEG